MRQFVEKNEKGTRWAIPDIHGCIATFKKLVEEVILLSKEDQLFLLGDYIDKGKHGAKVIDFILALQQEGFQVYPLRGNHEENFLEAYKEYDTRTFELYVSRLTKNVGLTKNGIPKPEHLKFFESLPLVIETNDFVMAHAAVKPYIDYSQRKYVLEQYIVELTREELNGKTLLRGHQPTDYAKIENSVRNRHTVISLDNGCVYSRKKKKLLNTNGLGKLVAFNLDTFELISTENCEVSQ